MSHVVRARLFDFAIIGSGFAGSLLAAVLAKHGKSVVLVDQRRHPRFTVGESSTPLADLILEKIADHFDLPEVRAFSRFATWRREHPEIVCGKKRGFSYFRHFRGCPFNDSADHPNSMLVTASPDDSRADTHWMRSDVDQFFFELAIANGAESLLGNVVDAPAEQSSRKIIYQDVSTGEAKMIHATTVVDAGGLNSHLRQSVGISDHRDTLHTNTRSTYGHFVNVKSWQRQIASSGSVVNDYPFDCDDAAAHHLLDDGWIWVLRFCDGRASVGWTRPCKNGDSKGGAVQNDMLASFGIRGYRDLEQLFSDAQLVPYLPSPVETERLQRFYLPVVADRYVMMPTACAVVDPLHSSGIAHGVSGVYRLAKIFLESSLESSQQSLALNRYATEVVQEIKLLDLLVAGCYAAAGNFQLFRAHAMFYFVAAILSEERVAIESAGGTLWSSDQAELVAKAGQSMIRIQEIMSKGLGDKHTRDHVEWVEAAIKSWNRFGLMVRESNNMYRYTAAPK